MSMVMGFDGLSTGLGSYVSCGAGASLNINGANQLTLIARFKMRRTCASSWGIISKDNDLNAWQYMLYYEHGTPVDNVYGYISDGVASEFTPAGPVQLKTIYHVAYVLTAARHKLYINGVEISAPGTARTRNPQNQAGWLLYLGKYAGGHFTDMNLYEAQVYNRDLSVNEIIYNMNHPNNPIRQNCVLNLTQESLFGGQWKDLSGNANHGTLSATGVGPVPSNLIAGRNASL